MLKRYLANFDLSRLPQVSCDVLVVGTGIAGLYTALKVREVGRVIVLTKRKLEESNTEYAQGGIAAAIGDEDSPRLHLLDTLEAGAGLCDEDAVKVLVEEGPDCVRELIEFGTQFDKNEEGNYELTREGAHSERRILHARGDATGDEIRRALQQKAYEENITVYENRYIVDVLTHEGRCIGVLALDERDRLTAYLARATILATGGAGQMYINSTNPEVATGDGIAIAYRAGAELQDIEFVQFHPTALYGEGSPKFLISEAVRGEGALLLNKHGERFMLGYHPRAELAPRDIVARAIVDQMRQTKHPCVYEDARALPNVEQRFPSIYAACLKQEIDLKTDLIPVAPAAHYMMGGIKTDVDGRTNIPGLYACGEVACTGIHGANRLASNSLVEGLVFGRRIANALIEGGLPPLTAPNFGWRMSPAIPDRPVNPLWAEIQQLMWDKVGIARNAAGLSEAIARLEAIVESLGGALQTKKGYQVANLATVALLVARAALTREESRGGHFRSDYPRRDDENWQRHVVQRRSDR
ncbi:MAG TPA: L-aspartate oxidase [Symbiobacteriaceae bacterium]|nr:L-aspartate oxidase [Symbiobacteriaceae bacterium]